MTGPERQQQWDEEARIERARNAVRRGAPPPPRFTLSGMDLLMLVFALYVAGRWAIVLFWPAP